MTLPIDLSFPGVGRLHLRSGTQKKVTRNAMKEMLRSLYQTGHADILRDLKANKLSVMDLFERYRLGKLHELPTGGLMQPLVTSWREWLAGKEVAPKTRQDYEKALDRLAAFGSPGVPLADLPKLAAAHRKASMGAHPRTFNKDRAAALSMLADLFDDNHWLYREVRRAKTLKIPDDRKMPFNPQTVAECHALAAGLTVKGQPHHAVTLWGIALTGMRPEEFFEEDCNTWTLEPEQVRIAGTKTKAAKRVAPRIGLIVKPSTKRRAFADALSLVSATLVTPYDLRRSYSQWCEAAGIPDSRLKFYFGHGPTNPTELYKRQKECLPYLRQDTEALTRYTSEPVGLRVMK
jgi:integrase